MASHHTVTVPRSIFTRGNTSIHLHGFADASRHAVCAVIYAVELHGGEPISQNLLVAKSRIAPAASIPHLELIAALDNSRITNLYYWSDSTTVLHWLNNQGTLSVFVRNRIKKIHELSEGLWQHVPTAENPADLGTKPVTPTKLGTLWLKGPSYLLNGNWPDQPKILPTEEALTEEMKPKLKAMLAMDGSIIMNEMIQRFSYWKLMRITALIFRFQSNCLKHKRSGPLTTDEIDRAETSWIILIQKEDLSEMKEDKIQDKRGVWRVVSRIPNYDPILLPKTGEFTSRIVENYHERTTHGGVQTTMAKIREKFWIPHLRAMSKKIIFNCNMCKRFRVKQLKAPAVAALPEFRTEFTRPFAATGVDFAGPMLYKVPQPNAKGKYYPVPEQCYIALFTCAATRAVHLKLVGMQQPTSSS